MIPHGLLLAARIPPHYQSMSLSSSIHSWSAERLLLEDNIAVHVLRDFPTPQHQSQQLPQLQIKAVVGMLIMAHRG
jgi:hypothetical protein